MAQFKSQASINKDKGKISPNKETFSVYAHHAYFVKSRLAVGSGKNTRTSSLGLRIRLLRTHDMWYSLYCFGSRSWWRREFTLTEKLRNKDQESGGARHQAALQAVDLREAIHLIRNAGYPDPRDAGEEEGLLQRVLDALCALSMHDGLTGLSNLRYFRIALKREVHRAARNGESCTLLMIDIDHFKAINDTYGHPVGDRVLEVVAHRLQEGLRPVDTIARYGGEEFAAILPNCPLRYAVKVADRLRASIADEAIPIPGKAPIKVTLSVGVSCTKSWAEPKAQKLLEAADQNLYKAKANGRNQVWSEAARTAEISPAERAALFGGKK